MRLLDGGDNVKTKRLVKTKCLVQEILINVFRLVYSIASWEPFQFLIVCSLCVIFEEFLHEATALFSEQNGWAIAFEVLFLFKYLKVVVHTISFLLYRPFPIPVNPTVRCGNVTVIIPTVGAIDEPEFRETIRSILINRPFEVIVCTVGGDKFRAAEKVCAEEAYPLPTFDPATRVKVMAISHASKRDQVFAAIQEVQTSTIIALADDHVFWGPHFLRASLAPFEDHRIGAVGTNKRVRRYPFEFTWANFLNFVACNYLERHNFECTASVGIDQAVFVLSGRTSLYRTSILQHREFAKAYLHETWWFGRVGKNGYAVDDDNLLTRFTIGTAGYKLWFQNSEESTLHTTLGDPAKFFKQMDRWIRTTWRSNLTSLFSDQTPWRTQPWSVYAIYFSSFVNFALFYDFALLATLSKSLEDLEYTLGIDIIRALALSLLLVGLFLSKMIKPFPHFWRNPKDVLWIPGYVMFGYYHSVIKLKALFTVHIVAWGTRPGVD